MQIIAPVTDYIPASILTTLNDIVVRGAAGPERLAEVNWRGCHIGNDTRNTAGDQVIAGVGFLPSVVIFLATDGDTTKKNISFGFDNGASHMCKFWKNDGINVASSLIKSIKIYQDAGNNMSGEITALGADGFTITWALAGVRQGLFIYLCLP